MEKNSSNYRLLSGLFFRLLPFQVLLLIITSVNGIVDSLYASNQIGQTAMGAIGELTGASVREDITDRIFERFCVGK